MESVLLKANLVNLSTGQYWLNLDGKKGMSDREGHGHKAVLYKSQFPPLRHSLLERHCCIHRLINHVYTKASTHSLSLPHDTYNIHLFNKIANGMKDHQASLSCSINTGQFVLFLGCSFTTVNCFKTCANARRFD